MATKLLASAHSSVLCVFGAGAQADLHIRYMRHVRPTLRTIYIINRSVERAAQLVQKLLQPGDVSPSLLDRTVVAHAAAASTTSAHAPADCKEKAVEVAMLGMQSVAWHCVDLTDATAVKHAVHAADIIVTATNSNTPLFDGRDVRAGCHLNCVGSYRPTMQEIDSHVVCAAVASGTVTVDCEAAIAEAGDLCKPIGDGVCRADTIKLLGEWLATNSSPRTSPQQVSIFKSVGTSVKDVATAQLALEIAERRSCGSRITL